MEIWSLRRMQRISWTEKESYVEVMTAEGVQRELMKTIRQRHLNFLKHVMRRRRHGLEHLAVTGKVDDKRGRGRQRLKYLDSLCTCLKDEVNPIELVSSGPQRTGSSSITWSPTSLKMARRHLKEIKFRGPGVGPSHSPARIFRLCG